MNFNFKKIVFCLCSLLLFSNIYSQNFTHQQSVIDFLDRMAQKGKIEFNDLMKPVDRTTVYQLLDQLQNKTDLNEIEKKEVAFFIQLYQFDHISDTINIKPQFSYLTQNKKIQPPLFSYIDKDFRVIFNPLFEYTVNTFSKSSILASSGFQLMGYVGKKFGFQMSIRDVNETGHFDSTKLDNSAMGIIRKTTINPQQLNYSQFNASISYRINKATFTLGQGQQTIGYGKMGNIVLSDKAPSYPFFKIIYTPTRWLKFNYMHAWLQSGIVDSTKTYGLGNTVYGGKREIYVPKFFATHFVEIIPMRGLSINLGESIVYTDQLEVPYLIPISFFKAFDNNKFGDNILAGANGQIFMGISSRNQLPKTHLYAQLFVDEIRVSSAFISSKSRNQLGYQLGASVTDVILPTLTFSAEYTRINPFVYRNFIPAQNYTSSKYYLGDWMGANADRLFFSAQYKPKAKALVKAFYMLMGKGGQGTIEDQYFAQPQPIFGFDPKYKRTQFGLEAYYELFNNIQCRFSHIITTQKPYLQGSTEQTTTSLGFIWSRL